MTPPEWGTLLPQPPSAPSEDPQPTPASQAWGQGPAEGTGGRLTLPFPLLCSPGPPALGRGTQPAPTEGRESGSPGPGLAPTRGSLATPQPPGPGILQHTQGARGFPHPALLPAGHPRSSVVSVAPQHQASLPTRFRTSGRAPTRAREGRAAGTGRERGRARLGGRPGTATPGTGRPGLRSATLSAEPGRGPRLLLAGRAGATCSRASYLSRALEARPSRTAQRLRSAAPLPR